MARSPPKGKPAPIQAGRRWPVERTHSWMNGYGKLRRFTDRRKVIVEFYLNLAAALTVLRRLINRAAPRIGGRPAPPPADSADPHLPGALGPTAVGAEHARPLRCGRRPVVGADRARPRGAAERVVAYLRSRRQQLRGFRGRGSAGAGVRRGVRARPAAGAGVQPGAVRGGTGGAHAGRRRAGGAGAHDPSAAPHRPGRPLLLVAVLDEAVVRNPVDGPAVRGPSSRASSPRRSCPP